MLYGLFLLTFLQIERFEAIRLPRSATRFDRFLDALREFIGVVITELSPRLLAVIGLRGIPDVIGGIETHCENLLPRLQPLLPDTKVIVYARAPYVDATRSEFKGIEIVALDSPRRQRIETFIHTLAALFHARFKRGIRFVNFHGIGPGLFTPLARLLGMVVVVTHHGQDYKRPGFGRASKVVTGLGEKLAVLSSHRVITVSRLVAEDLKQRFPWRSGRIVHVPNGIGDEWMAVSPSAPNGTGDLALLSSLGVEPGRYVLAVGRIDPGKGMDDLINAFANTDFQGKLLIIGSAVASTPFSRALMAKATDRIVFGGFHPQSAMRVLYRNASLFVLPSLHEGLSISLLEALASGTPVLVSDIGANMALDLPAQCYFPVSNVEELTKALVRPHSDFAAGEGFQRERYNWENIVQQTATIYLPLLNGNLGPLSQS